MTIQSLLPLIMELAKLAPGLITEVGDLLRATSGNPTAADWQALADKVAAKPFDAP